MLLKRYFLKVNVQRPVEISVHIDANSAEEARENFLKRCQDSKKLMPTFLPEVILRDYELSEAEKAEIQVEEIQLFRDFRHEHVQSLLREDLELGK